MQNLEGPDWLKSHLQKAQCCIKLNHIPNKTLRACAQISIQQPALTSIACRYPSDLSICLQYHHSAFLIKCLERSQYSGINPWNEVLLLPWVLWGLEFDESCLESLKVIGGKLGEIVSSWNFFLQLIWFLVWPLSQRSDYSLQREVHALCSALMHDWCMIDGVRGSLAN